MKLRLFVLSLVTAIGLCAAETPPLFNATLTMGKVNRFVLASPVTGKTSGWIGVGDTYEGYTVKAYDAKSGALDLEHEGKTVRVMLVADAAVGNAPAAPTPATLAEASALMNKIHIDDLLERTIAQQKKLVTSQLSRMGLNIPNVNKDDLAGFQTKVLAELDGALDVGKMKEDLTRIYSEAFTKDEIDQMSAFYDTPLGQTLIAKQPEIQQKMQAAILPRVQELGPKIGQMARDFAMDQQAKNAAAAGGAAAPATPAAPATTPPKP